ncbi:protein Flattop homolog isoform X2 [Drosophila obscura]|uniref:protein Flattop homolog isoform X2 n=1 Tax=Drosophila obscura TaxID=7282 RepID=UPI001BB0D9B4|nr:protein Flattop homolog isoform X2 [Drosophila obscura]
MAFHFSANQAPGLCNWEYPRFAPPRPRRYLKKATPIVDNSGHLLPTARRDGNSFGRYRGTYELPLKITRSFCGHYDACLSGRYKFRDFPRDLCNCQRENRRALACDKRVTLGVSGDPYWARPKCQSKCEGIQQIKELHQLSVRCKRAICPIKSPRTVCVPAKSRITCVKVDRSRKRTITAFAANREPSKATKEEAKTKAPKQPKK